MHSDPGHQPVVRTRPDASAASAAEARLKRGRVCTLLGRTSRLFPNRELCAARQRMPDEG